MIITCEQCATQYHLAGKYIQPTGSKVRCSKCHHIFMALPPTEDEVGLSESSPLASGDMAVSGFDHALDEPLVETAENEEDQILGRPGKEAPNDLELPELADELDKIFGTDDDSFSEGNQEMIEETVQNRYTGETETLDLSELDDGLNELLDRDHPAKKETAGEESIAGARGDTEMLDLSELGDDFDSVPGIDTPLKDAIETGSDSEFIEEIFLDELDDEIGEVADNNKEVIADVEAEIGPNLKKEPLPTEDDEKTDDLFKSESLAFHGQSGDLAEDIEDILSPEESTGLDTIQIQGFESDLDDLEDIQQEKRDTANVSEIEKNSSIDIKEIESAGQVSDEQNAGEVESQDVALEDRDESEPGTSDSVPKEFSEPDEDFNLDTRQIESFDIELENLDELTAAPDETQPKEASEPDEGFNPDPRQIESFDIELEHLDELTAVADETLPKETSESNENINPDPRQIESVDIELEDLDELELAGNGTLPKEVAEQDEPFILDTNQIESLDLELGNLDELELTTDETRLKDVSEQDEHFILDTNQIKSLDLELENPDELGQSDSGHDENIILDTDQIESLSLEKETPDESLEKSEPMTHDNRSKESSMLADDISADTDREKIAEVFNLNLERPDLDETFDLEDGIDLPVLDELLAPAEVTDETLIDSSFELTGNSESDLDEKLLKELEESSLDDSQPILELDTFDKQPDVTEKEIEPEGAQAAIQAEATLVTDTEKQVQQEAKTITKPANTVIPPGKMAGPGKFETPSRQRTGKWLMAPLVILLLLAMLFGINAMGVRVPFLSDLNIPFLSGGGQLANDLGNARIKTVDIDGKFITSKKSGRLFVITGEALNQYDSTRGFIEIKGNIYAGGGKLVATRSVHCGNILTDKDLAAKPFDDIQRYLTNKLGAGGAGTLNVKSEHALPFMIVFADLPPDIEEFSVEVIGSAAL